MATDAGLRPWWPAVESSPRWVRVRLGGAVVADSRRALLYIQYGPGPLAGVYLPTYYLPAADVRPGVLTDEVRDDERGVVSWTVRADGRRVERAAWSHSALPRELGRLADHVTFSWQRLDWYEEDERVVMHARDPYKRVDVAVSSRHVRVEVAGQPLAESSRPLVLFETALPVRYYLPREDVRLHLLRDSTTETICPYKGTARYWSAVVGGEVVEDVAWSYETPIPENPRIAGLVCFANEKVDLVVDGERLPRPVTPWS